MCSSSLVDLSQYLTDAQQTLLQAAQNLMHLSQVYSHFGFYRTCLHAELQSDAGAGLLSCLLSPKDLTVFPPVKLQPSSYNCYFVKMLFHASDQ